MRKTILVILMAILPSLAAQATTAAQLEKAKMLRAKSKFVAAKAILTEILGADPSAEAYKEMGNIYLLGERNLVEAQNYYEKALGLEPEYFPAINNLGVVALKNYEATLALGAGDPTHLEKAKEWFDKAIKLNPAFAGTYSELAKYYHYRQDQNTALETVNRALAIDDKYAGAYIVRGQIMLIGLKKYDEALSDFLAANKYQPDDPDLVHFLWVCYARLGKAKDSARYRKKYLTILKAQGMPADAIDSESKKQEAEWAAIEAEEKVAASTEAPPEDANSVLLATTNAKTIGRYKFGRIQKNKMMKSMREQYIQQGLSGQRLKAKLMGAEMGVDIGLQQMGLDMIIKANGYLFMPKGDDLGQPKKYKIQGSTLSIQNAETGEFKAIGKFNGNRSLLTILGMDAVLEKY